MEEKHHKNIRIILGVIFIVALAAVIVVLYLYRFRPDNQTTDINSNSISDEDTSNFTPPANNPGQSATSSPADPISETPQSDTTTENSATEEPSNSFDASLPENSTSTSDYSNTTKGDFDR